MPKLEILIPMHISTYTVELLNSISDEYEYISYLFLLNWTEEENYKNRVMIANKRLKNVEIHQSARWETIGYYRRYLYLLATEEYIMYMDCDDIFCEGVFQSIATVLQWNRDWYFFTYWWLNVPDDHKHIKQNNLLPPVRMNAIYRRKILSSNYFLDIHRLEDCLFNRILMQNNIHPTLTGIMLSKIRCRADSITRTYKFSTKDIKKLVYQLDKSDVQYQIHKINKSNIKKLKKLAEYVWSDIILAQIKTETLTSVDYVVPSNVLLLNT